MFNARLKQEIANLGDRLRRAETERESLQTEVADLQGKLAGAEAGAVTLRRCEFLAGLFQNMQSFAATLTEIGRAHV